ncbi:MAG: DnaJ domain-containing protein [Candidatus Limnocylindrales bacterium]
MPESIPDFDLYAELGVAPDADPDAIRSAHREAVRSAHPDVLAGEDADEDLAKRLNVARDWLTDPARRARYDEARGLGTWATEAGAVKGAVDDAPASAASGLVTGPNRRDAVGCLELGWWLLLIATGALIFAVLLVIVADL